MKLFAYLLCSELNIEPVIDECRLVLEEMKSASNDQILTTVQSTPFFKSSISVIERHHKDLTSSRQELLTSWQEAEARILNGSKGDKYRIKAEKVQ